jgi:hypothetical protein
VIGFAEHWPEAWPDLQPALEEVKDSLEENKISRIAINSEGEVVGWIAGAPGYCGQAWELHPLVVHPDYQSSIGSYFRKLTSEWIGIISSRHTPTTSHRTQNAGVGADSP